MRLLIDLQGAQTESRRRGIGRYSISLARAIIQIAGDHEVWIGLTAGLPKTVAYARAAIGDLLPDDRFLIWDSVTPTGDLLKVNDGRLAQAQVVREAAIAALAPDVVLCSSVIEGAAESAVATVNRHYPAPRTAVMLYDLIPLLDERYLDGGWERWYRRRLAELRRADLLLAISDSSAREGRQLLGISPDRLVNIHAAADAAFVPLDITPDRERELRERYEISKPFVLYTGGIDPRKNLVGLITAFAGLPQRTRDAHQLVLAGSGNRDLFEELKGFVKSQGLRADQVVFPGFVAEEDLAPLYNISKAFMFPSTHEGFGLPPLEAMSCGIPTVAADNSSLPEVLGNPDALFDTDDAAGMSAMLDRLLTDDDFRETLRTRGLEQARTFSWDTTAALALAALEELTAQPQVRARATDTPYRPRLALVTPLSKHGTPPRRRTLQIVDQLDATYDVHLVSESLEDVAKFEGPARLINVEDFAEVAGTFDRIVHHYGNSPEYGFVRAVQARHPGTVLLDDFHLDRALPTGTADLSAEAAWMQSVIEDHGYAVLHQQLEARRAGTTAARLMLNASVLRHAHGVMVTDPGILDLAASDLGAEAVADWAVVPLLLPGALTDLKARPRRTLLVFAAGGGDHLAHRVVSAWLASSLSSDPESELVVAGVRHDDPYGRLLARLLADGRPAARHRFTDGGADPTLSGDVRLAVQLSTAPDGEGSRAITGCRARGIAVLTNEAGLLPRDFSQEELVRALESLWLDASPERASISGPERADAYVDAIERFHTGGPLAFQIDVLRKAGQQPDVDDADWPKTVAAVMRNTPVPGPRQLFLDVSSLLRNDFRTGIQRVVRSLTRVLLLSPPEGLRVEPVYCDKAGLLRYARTYAVGLLGQEGVRLRNDPVVARRGDVFAGLDLNDRTFTSQVGEGPRHPVPMEGALEQLRSRGVSCQFLVYDLLPSQHPEWFPPELDWFHDYIRGLVTRGDGIICDSKSTADEVQTWIRENEPDRTGLPVRWFHLGADLESSAPTTHATPRFEKRWAKRGPGLSILMVGTLEPRKGHEQAVAAFSHLWRQGVDANLVLVGRAGWGMDTFMANLPRHPEWGKRLLWFKSASDEELLRLYQASDGFLMTSRGEGFGLPIIEAARHHIPVMSRDLPVFREVAGDHSRYFSGDAPGDLASDLQSWLSELAAGSAPSPSGIRARLWDESTSMFLEALSANLADQGAAPPVRRGSSGR